MATAIVFDLISALVTTCAAAVPAGVTVYDGQGTSDDPGNFLLVGTGDPDSEEEADSASGDIEWAGLGHKTSKERGSIECCAVAILGDSGDAAQKSVRQAVRDISSAIETALRTDPSLGGAVPGLNWVRYAGAWRLRQSSDSMGVRAVFTFELAYVASL